MVFFLTQSCSTAIDLWVLETQSRNVVSPLRVAAVLNENSSKVGLHFAGFTLLNASTEEGNNHRLMLVLIQNKYALNLITFETKFCCKCGTYLGSSQMNSTRVKVYLQRY